MYSADSPGRSTLRTDPILIFDLDGTLLSVNSFPYWVRYMLSGRFGGLKPSRRLALSLRTARILLERKLLGRSHYYTKRSLQALWAGSLAGDAAAIAAERLSATLQNHVRPNLSSVMATVASGRADALLATSAAGEYAQAFGKSLGFLHILATPLWKETDKAENRAERKRDRVLKKLMAEGWHQRPRFFFTDHEEDLPLMSECQRIFWFGRDEEAVALQPKVRRGEIIACGQKTDLEILHLAIIPAGSLKTIAF